MNVCIEAKNIYEQRKTSINVLTHEIIQRHLCGCLATGVPDEDGESATEAGGAGEEGIPTQGITAQV